MKYIKKYEQIYLGEEKDKIQIGDCILLHTNSPLDEYLDQTIGEVNYIDHKEVHVVFPPEVPNVRFSFHVYFKFYHDRYGEGYFFRRFKLSDIKYFSSNKEDLEEIINANKYNL